MKKLSRRTIMRGAVASIAGLALTGSVGLSLPGCARQEAAGPAEVGVPEWPWRYVKLDPDVAGRRAYDAYLKAG
jgi:hypothetical protein